MADILLVIFGVSLLFASITNMLSSIVRILILQGIMLFVLTILKTNEFNMWEFSFVALETIVFKAILIPWFIMDTIRKNGIKREVEPSVSNFFSLGSMTAIFAFAFFIALWSGKSNQNLYPLHFGIAFAAILKGLFIIIANKKLITHLMGYLIMENGIFLLSLALGSQMPHVVSLGVSLDIMLSILIAVLFINKISNAFEDVDSDGLSTLKD
ncbi:hydrogenase [Candidatus Cloacimonadota bacterium]